MSRERLVGARLEISFGDDPFAPLQIRDRLTGRTVCANGVQSLLVRTPQEISEPAFLTRGTLRRVGTSVRCRLADPTGRYRAAVTFSPSADGIVIHARVTAPVPLWLVEWRLTGLQCREMIVPALGGQALSGAMPTDVTLSYKYPFWWNAQFVIGQARRGGFVLESRDPGPSFKLLRIRRQDDGFALTYGCEADAPLRSRTLESTWYLDAFDGPWTTAVDRHRAWMEQAFGAVPLARNRFAPPWLDQIDIVLELWGMRKDQQIPHHTFDQMITRLRDWRTSYDPARTLVYLPGFAEHGIDSHAPDYGPSKECGGPEKFRQLIRVAHAMGYKVMVHTNVLAMTFTHRLFARFRKHQVVDLFGRTQGWGLDLDGDWLFEPYFAYINPGVKAWGNLMEQVIGGLIEQYGVDGVFLDQTLLAFNTSKGPNFLAGMRTHIDRLRHAFPSTLFAGEGLHEQVVSVLPLAQIHGIDSIFEVHGMDGPARWRTAHPVSTRLFGPYTRFVAHLLTRHPSSPAFAAQEEAYARLGVLPALCLYDADQRMDMPAVKAMVRRARRRTA